MALTKYRCRTALTVGLFLALVCCGLFLLLEQAAAETAAETPSVVTLGADLTADQQQAILRILNVTPGAGVRVLTVTNAEERALLGNDLPESVIGTKAISSASVALTGAGTGLQVERYNITFVTPAMYGNALATAGVKDARTVVAAPVPVSGTAALTGIFKAFEQATGKNLEPEAKETAGDELVTTGELAKDIGNAKATELLARVKERVAGENLQDPGRVRQVVTGVADDLNIELTNQQEDQVTNVAVRIGQLNLQADELKEQLTGLRETIADLAEDKETKGFLQRILDVLVSLFNRVYGALTSWLGKAFS